MVGKENDHRPMEGCCALHDMMTKAHSREHERLESEHSNLWGEVNGMKKWAMGLITALLLSFVVHGYLTKIDTAAIAQAVAIEINAGR